MTKRIISLILCIVILTGSFGFTVFADEVEAVIGGTEYSTLEEALAASRNGDVIILKGDVAVEETVNVTKTLTMRAESSATVKGAFDITGSLTLMNICIDASELEAEYGVSVTGGNFTMRSGSSVIGGIFVDGGVFNFYGGSISAANIKLVDDSATFRMSGDASFEDQVSISLPTNAYVEITGELTGEGDISITVPSINSGDRVATLTGGISLDATQLARFKIKDESSEYTVLLNGNDVIADKPVGSTDVAKIGDVGYPTLAEAFAAAAESSATITLTSVVVIDSPITVKGNVTLSTDGNYTLYAGKSVGGSLFVVSKDSSLKISDKDNTITVSGRDNGAALFDVQGTLSIDSSVIITGNVNNSEKHNKGTVYVNGGTFNMAGGSISGNKGKSGTVYVASGSFNMTGGAINNNTATTAGGVYVAGGSFTLGGGSIYGNSGDGVWTAGSFTLAGSGSIFSSATYPATVFLSNSAVIKVKENWKPSAASAGYSNVITVAMTEPKIYDTVAEFEGTPSKDSFKMSERYEGKFTLTVKEKKLIVGAADEVYTVYWGNNPYMSIEEAVAALPENTQATLKIVGDTTVSAPVVIKKGMNIIITTDTNPGNLSEYKSRTVKRGAEFASEMFRVEKGASLTLEAAKDKTLVFDGEGKKVTGALVTTAGGTVIGKGAVIKANNNKTSEKLATPSVFTFGGGVYVEKGGSCSINGGSISGNYASYGGGVYVNDGALSMSEGAEIKENGALYGGGVYLETSGSDKEVRATFAMAGGKLTGNKATNAASIKDSGVAGGVFITNGSSFMMSDGSIEKNTASLASGVCVGVLEYADEIPVPEFTISDKATIATDNTVHLAIPNISVIKVSAVLTSTTATTVSIPEAMPQNMKLVVFAQGEKEATNEAAAKKAFEAKRFVLDKAASEYFKVSQSYVDKAVLINTAGDHLPSRTKAGKYYNGLAAYEEEDEKDTEKETEKDEAKDNDKDEGKDKEELRTPIIYDPTIIRENGSFTTVYEFSYYPNLYKSINTYITAPFPEGTRIVMIDTTDEESVGYYYYEVTGDEAVVGEADGEDDKKKLPDTIEIPLVNFYQMGTTDKFYEPKVNEDTAKKAMTTEKLLFTVDFTDILLDESVSFEGELSMVLNHYYPGSAEGERYDISGNEMLSEFTISTVSSSSVTLTATEDGCYEVSYELSDDSVALAHNKGVILFQSGNESFPRGTVISDEKGKQYVAAGKSDVIAVPMPVDKDGNVEKKGKLKVTLGNYYGTAIVESTMRCVIAASDDGKHYTVGAAYDAESDGVNLELDADDEYAILVTTLDGEKKPYYEDYNAVKKLTSLEMSVSGLVNNAETATFNLALLKKDGEDYVSCSLSELFKVSAEYGNEVILNTGNLSLELTADIDALIGNEYKIVFKVGDAVEYVKVNVIEAKK
ncbi:MAG: hypothetical protein IJA55_04135 [Clostridia bacterium]|nr:hypothetical protein [Clostridia bacterium]